MPSLSVEEVRQKRTELLEKGFTVIPGVLDREFVDELKVWADGLVSANPPNDKFRYQGSDIHVFTEERWERRVHLTLGPTRMPDPMAGKSKVANESRKQAARRPRPPLPKPMSCSTSETSSKSYPS